MERAHTPTWESAYRQGYREGYQQGVAEILARIIQYLDAGYKPYTALFLLQNSLLQDELNERMGESVAAARSEAN